MQISFESLREYIKGLGLRKIANAIFTQSMLSLTSFAAGILIAKYATKSEYGMYVVLFSILGIVGNYQTALINTPMTVLAHKKSEYDQIKFISGLSIGQWIIIFPLVAFIMLSSYLYCYVTQEYTLLKYIMVLAFASVTFLWREFIRSLNYLKMQINLIVKMDVLFVVAVLTGIGILIVTNKVNSIYSMVVLGIGYLFAALLEQHLTGMKHKVDLKIINKSLGEAWHYGRWAMLGVTSDIFKNRGYIYVVTAILGIEKNAEINVARLFLMPISLIVTSSGRILLAKGAEILSKKGSHKFKIFIAFICIAIMGIWLLYVIFLAASSKYFISFFGDKYENINAFVIMWSLYFLVYSLRYIMSTVICVYKEFKQLAKFDVISSVVTVIACLILTNKYLGLGAITAVLLGEIVLLLLTTRYLLSYIKRPHQEDPIVLAP